MSNGAIYNFNSTSPVQITREQYSDVGSSAFQLGLVRRGFKGSTDLEVWTAVSGGTQLTENTDYTLGSVDSNATAKAGYNVYTSVTVTNATYQTGQIYITYKVVGSYPNAGWNEPYYNFIYNPDGNIDQDGFSGSAPVAGSYTLDMWESSFINTGNQPTLTIKRNTVVGEGLEVDDISESALHLDVSTGGTAGTGENGDLRLDLPEWDNKYKGETFTFAAKIKGTLGGVMAVQIFDGASTSTKTIVHDGNWNDYYFSHTINPSATRILILIKYHSVTYTVVAGDYYLKQIRLYKGSDYKPYQPRGFKGDLEKCMSVYEKTFAYGTPPSAALAGSEYTWKLVNSVSVLEFDNGFVVPKIIVPTITWYSPVTGAANKIYDYTATSDVTVSSTSGTTITRTGYPTMSASIAADRPIRGHWVADSRL